MWPEWDRRRQVRQFIYHKAKCKTASHPWAAMRAALWTCCVYSCGAVRDSRDLRRWATMHVPRNRHVHCRAWSLWPQVSGYFSAASGARPERAVPVSPTRQGWHSHVSESHAAWLTQPCQWIPRGRVDTAVPEYTRQGWPIRASKSCASALDEVFMGARMNFSR